MDSIACRDELKSYEGPFFTARSVRQKGGDKKGGAGDTRYMAELSKCSGVVIVLLTFGGEYC